jgi:hypothetical protein
MTTFVIVLAVLGIIADHLTTVRALGLGGRELNPVARWLIAKWSHWAMLLFVIVMMGGMSWFLCAIGSPGGAKLFLALAGGLKLVAGYRNWRVGNRIKEKQS